MHLIQMRTCLPALGLLLALGAVASAAEPAADQAPIWLISAPESANHRDGDAHAAEGHNGKDGNGGHREEPQGLFLSNFLGSGWTERFEEREREGRAPRFNLFKSRQGFLERMVFINYAYTGGLENRSFNEHEVAGGLEWALFMTSCYETGNPLRGRFRGARRRAQVCGEAF